MSNREQTRSPEQPSHELQQLRDVVEHGEMILDMTLMRHGPKMSAAGEKNVRADDFVTAVEKGVDDADISVGSADILHIRASTVDRAKGTGAVVDTKLRGEAAGKVKSGRDSEWLVPPHRPDNESEAMRNDFAILVNMQKTLEPIIRKQLVEEGVTDPADQEAQLRERLDRTILGAIFSGTVADFIQDMNARYGTAIADDFTTTTDTLSFGLEHYFSSLIRHLPALERTKAKRTTESNTTPYQQVTVSHSYPIMGYLRKHLVLEHDNTLVRASDLSPSEFFEKVGGVIPESGNVRLGFHTQGDTTVVTIHGKTFEGFLQ